MLLERPLDTVEPQPEFRIPMIEVGVTLNTLRGLGFYSSSWVMLSV